MYARFGVAKVKPGKVDEFVNAFRDMVSVTRNQKGFKGVTVLANPETNEVTAFSLWETEADARSVATSTASFQSQIDKVKDLIDEAPTTQYLEVRYQE